MEKEGSRDELESDWQLTLRCFYMASHINSNPKHLLVQFLKGDDIKSEFVLIVKKIKFVRSDDFL